MGQGKNLSFLDQFEVGGSFFELIEFSLLRQLPDGRKMMGLYGLNVAKVREVVHMPRINPLASSIPGVAGIFELRGVPIPAVNLCHVLGDSLKDFQDGQQIIVTEFSLKRAGFIVNSTHRIRRIAWDKVLPPSSDSGSSMSGMILVENNEFLFILDLEKIVAEIEAQDAINSSAHSHSSLYHGDNREEPRAVIPTTGASPGILLVDDSKLILSNVSRFLAKNGFRVLTAENGEIAYHKLMEVAEGKSTFGHIQCVITDVEMPKMNGINLTKKIRGTEALKNLPIFLHTSLSGTATQSEAKSAGANGYVVKNDLECILEMIREVVTDSTVPLGA